MRNLYFVLVVHCEMIGQSSAQLRAAAPSSKRFGGVIMFVHLANIMLGEIIILVSGPDSELLFASCPDSTSRYAAMENLG